MTNLTRILALTIALLVSSDCSRTLRVRSLPGNMAMPGAGGCHYADGLPDPLCTPGAIDPRVTQSNLRETICAKGYTVTVRPPVSYTNPLKFRQIVQYGYMDLNPKDYEEDHLIPLELGGSPADPLNLWPEPGKSPNPKDAVERRLHHLVCAGKMTLAEAQTRVSVNWTTALK